MISSTGMRKKEQRRDHRPQGPLRQTRRYDYDNPGAARLLLSLVNFTSEEAADITASRCVRQKTHRKASSKRAVPASIFRPLEHAVCKKVVGLQTLRATRWCAMSVVE